MAEAANPTTKCQDVILWKGLEWFASSWALQWHLVRSLKHMTDTDSGNRFLENKTDKPYNTMAPTKLISTYKRDQAQWAGESLWQVTSEW